MEIKSISIALVFVAIMTILIPSVVGVGEMADNEDKKKESGWISKLLKENNWAKKFLDAFNFKKFTGSMNSDNSRSDDNDSDEFDSEDFSSGDFSSGDVFSPSHICGNGKIDTDSASTETCEPPNTATCDSKCHLKKFCGDGIINQPSEQCEPPNTATCDASCKFRDDNNFEHAFIDFKLEKFHVDPNGEPDSGDEYFDNLITECSFHSDESIEGKVCLTCLIVDEKMEPCEDIFLNFQNLADGTKQEGPGGINAALAPFGITVKGIATNALMPDDLVMWDADVNHAASVVGPPNEDDDIESAIAPGDCVDCLGYHILIFPDDENSDGIPEPGDDSASGGTIVFTFDTPQFVKSFDIIDIENDNDAVAIAYSEALSDTECKPDSKIKEVPIPLVNNAEVETVVVDADNVRCLTIKYKDSGGISNLDLRCIKQMNSDGVLSEGKLELENGYVGSTHLSIPLESGVDVQKAVGVRIKSQCEVPPQENCVCDKPDTFTVEYNGPTMDKVVISGNHGSFAINGPITSGFDIVATGTLLNTPNGKMPPNTTYDFYKGTSKKGSITIHTSCSQTLFVGQMFTTTTSLGVIKLTVLSGTLNGVPSIPDASCPNIPRVIFSTGFETESELAKWNKDNSRTTTPNPGNIVFSITNTGAIGPHGGTKYLGGSGDIDDNTSPIIDPAWAAYNRDPINISGYTNILLSLWYSYESTESADEFALYYRVDGGSWVQMLDVPSPAIGNGNQKPWEQLQVAIPNGNTLEIQFRWETSQSTEHVMIDDLEISGVLP